MGRIQIAGIRDEAEAAMLVAEGVDDLAFPLGPGVRAPDCSVAEAAAIVGRFRDVAGTLLITYLSRAAEIVPLADALGVGGVQLHGVIAPEEVAALRRERPALQILKSLVVGSDDVVAVATLLEPYVDGFLTDTFDRKTGARGATGRRHDWTVSRGLVERCRRPLILAGGLNAENVSEAIRLVRPAGVDSHTGVEGADGRKDRDQVRRFVAAARSAFAAVRSRK